MSRWGERLVARIWAVPIALGPHGQRDRARSWWASPADFDYMLELGPPGKVPSLVMAGGECLWDGRAFGHFARSGAPVVFATHEQPRRRQVLRVEVAAVGLTERAYEHGMRISTGARPARQDPTWIARLERQIASALACLERAASRRLFLLGPSSSVGGVTSGPSSCAIARSLPFIRSGRRLRRAMTVGKRSEGLVGTLIVAGVCTIRSDAALHSPLRFGLCTIARSEVSAPTHGTASNPGKRAFPEIVRAYIEIVPTDGVKYEIDKHSGYLMVDRPQRFSSFCPTLYGFVRARTAAIGSQRMPSLAARTSLTATATRSTSAC